MCGNRMERIRPKDVEDHVYAEHYPYWGYDAR